MRKRTAHRASDKRNGQARNRKSKGAALLLFVVLSLVAFTSCLVASSALIKLVLLKSRAQTAAEAAALQSAQALSTVTIEDEHFGLIGLSDLAPSQNSPKALDGKPLPITSINTLTASTRASLIIAEALGNDTLRRLSLEDSARVKEAALKLTAALAKALAKQEAKARLVYLANLEAAGIKDHNLTKFVLKLGRKPSSSKNQDTAVSTITPVPKPYNLAGLSSKYYPAFTDTPVGRESFQFFAVGTQTALLPVDNFQEISCKGETASAIASLVKVDAEVSQDLGMSIKGVKNSACALPCALEDRSQSGLLVFGLPQGMPGGYETLQDLLSDHQHALNAPLFISQGGDYPAESEATLAQWHGLGASPKSTNVFALGFYDWLRTAHGRYNLESVLNTVLSRVQPSAESFRPGQSLVYRIKNHSVITEAHSVGDVPDQKVHENQIYTVAWSALQATNGTWNLNFRDQVRHLGRIAGGRHAGQSMECDGYFGRNSNFSEADRKAYFDGGIACEIILTLSPPVVSQQN
ncbi:MAG: hypothetical protein K2Y32_19300 [Candidatus Obscuribacterales bacterium]|nr:hypothetical protein [Candidatus Obscuribacterales bacterium]